MVGGRGAPVFTLFISLAGVGPASHTTPLEFRLTIHGGAYIANQTKTKNLRLANHSERGSCVRRPKPVKHNEWPKKA